jgi:beta-galactosidase/beta-glucuronidase
VQGDRRSTLANLVARKQAGPRQMNEGCGVTQGDLECDATDATAHPQPLLRRPWIPLDGEWDFAADPDAAATRPGQVAFVDRVTVPFAPETSASGIGWQGPLHRAWYRRSLPAARPGLRTVLHFGAVDRCAEVWVGNAHVASHEGGYTGFAVDVTDHVADGADLIVCADDDPVDLDAPRGKQDWRDEPHEIWYPRTTGIWRTVWLEHVASRHVAELDWDGDPITLEVGLRARLSAPDHGSQLRVRVHAGARLLVDDTLRVDGLEVQRRFRLGDGGVDDREALLWWPSRSVLLDAEVALLNAGGDVLDEVRSYTALRQVECEDGAFLLNGRPLPLRLVLDQGYWPHTGATPPNTAALRNDLALTRALGFHGARKHQKTEDPRYLAWADQLGMLVWAEMPSAYRSGPTSARRLLTEWAEIVRAHRGYPSVVAWVPVNESWGVPAVQSDATQRALLRALDSIANALDGSRPVSLNDGWETVGGGIVGVHDYDQDPAVLAGRYATPQAVASTLARRRTDGRLADLERQGPEGRAVILSEFGGVALHTAADESSGWGYGRPARGPQDLLRRYRDLWAVVHASTGLAGACWTQLTDTYQEINGLLTADRVPKADLDLLCAATRGQ